MEIIGKRNLLAVVRSAPPGVYLDGGEAGEILLPNRFVPRNLAPGGLLEVFVYLDSEDRLVATTETPFAMVGDFACLKVVSVNRQVGAFLDWGLAKDLLLPFREQVHPIRVGQRVVAYIYVDQKTHRIVASTRLNRHLKHEPPLYRTGQPAELLIYGKTPLGYTAVVDNAYAGLLYHDRLATPLTIGQRLQGFVSAVRPGGKLDLSLDASGYKRVAPLKEQILEALERQGGRLDLDDDTSPEAIREAFGVSKKAFKQALGALYKARRIRFESPGIRLVDNTAWEPGGE